MNENISRRDYFAIKILQSFCALQDKGDKVYSSEAEAAEDMARAAVMHADALIAELDKDARFK